MKIWIILGLIGLAQGAGWSYDGHGSTYGPSQWATYDPKCAAMARQSPIDLVDFVYHSGLTEFHFTGYDNMLTDGDLELVNNGHTAVLNVRNIGNTKVSGGGLEGEYIAAQLHYHWGVDDTQGSEHFFMGYKYPLEVHIVHYKASYGSLTDALTHGDGLAVLGFFFTPDYLDNSKLTPLIDGLTNIVYKGSKTNITMNFLDTMPDDLSHLEYYRYNGSLTTPTCDEAVVWTVFENKIKISSAQLERFRQLFQMEQSAANNLYLAENFRPLQALNGRVVYKSYRAVSTAYHWEYSTPYEGVHTWDTYYPTCRGKMQSPIDIPAVTSNQIAQYSSSRMLHTLEFENYDLTVTGAIKNNGHTIQVDVDETTNMHIHQGGLEGRFKVAQFHFHWGRNSNEGSEHTHAGVKYPLELHIVHYNESYGSLANAAGKFDGLAVVGFWFEVGPTNTKYATIIQNLPDVKFKNANKAISGFTLRDITFGDLKSSTGGVHHNFYRYQGGLTTPGCNEHVVWSVMTETIKISEAQLEEFRKMLHISSTSRGLLESDKIGWNYRPTQKLYDRVVYTSWNYEATLPPTAAAPITMQSVITSLFVTILSLFLR